jgi:Na+/H+-translocating membrane pyrophosphatase
MSRRYLAVFIVGFAALVLGVVGKSNGYSRGVGTAGAFVLGSLTSIVSGYIGMSIAVESNWRTTLAAKQSMGTAFVLAFRAGSVMGFGLCAVGLAVLVALIGVLNASFPHGSRAADLFECVAGYGLGGSAIALFARVGGGIYTKAADVGSDLAGKIDAGLPEDDPRNPGER